MWSSILGEPSFFGKANDLNETFNNVLGSSSSTGFGKSLFASPSRGSRLQLTSTVRKSSLETKTEEKISLPSSCDFGNLSPDDQDDLREAIRDKVSARILNRIQRDDNSLDQKRQLVFYTEYYAREASLERIIEKCQGRVTLSLDSSGKLPEVANAAKLKLKKLRGG